MTTVKAHEVQVGQVMRVKACRPHKIDRIEDGYSCSCGHTGWSAHIDLERLAIRDGHVTIEEAVGYVPEYPPHLGEQFRRRYSRPE